MELLEVANSPSKGRHIVTTKHISAGQLLLEQEPYAAVLYDDAAAVRCDHCLQPCQQPLRCGRCKFARYCSRAHQKAAWCGSGNGCGHKQECAALAACAPNVPPATARLAARVLWQRAAEAAAGCRRGSCWPDVEQLQHHWEQLDDERKAAYARLAVLTRQYMQGAQEPVLDSGRHAAAAATQNAAQAPSAAAGGTGTAALPEPKDIALLLARFACNNHTICDEELRPVGVGLYPLGALINHSCMPNAMQSFAGARIAFRAIRDIQPGEEVTISYIELAATRHERRQELLRHYFFDIDADGQQQQEQQQRQQQQSRQLLDHGAVLISCHGADSCPPWRQDPNDVELNQMVVQAADGTVQLLDGGMHAQIVATAQTSTLFDTDASFGVTEDAEVDEPQHAQANMQQGPAEQPQGIEITSWGRCWAEEAPCSTATAASTSGSSMGGAAGTPAVAAGTKASSEATARQLLQVLELQQRGEQLSKQGRSADAADAFQLALAMAAAGAAGSHAAALGSKHVLRMRLCAALLKVAIDAGDRWEAALQAARALAPMYELVYPKVWPNLGLHYATLAKLEHLLEHPQEAAAAAELAAHSLRATSPHGSVLQEVLRIRHEAQQELAAWRN